MEHKIGAIPFDIKNDRIALLFVTSQSRGRWIFPKGKRKKGESHKQGCKREAFEEAGVKGFVIEDAPLTNLITKSTKDGTAEVAVTYYPLMLKSNLMSGLKMESVNVIGLCWRMRQALQIDTIF